MIEATEQKNILCTGGSGLLGHEFQTLWPYVLYPTRNEFDISNYSQIDEYLKNRGIKTIIHAAAFTSPPKVDAHPEEALLSNIIGTSNVVRACIKHNIRLLYISTDYVFKGDVGDYKEDAPLYPMNKYAWSKLGGECAVRMYDNSVIIRTSFGPNEFPYEKAFTDQWTTREPVSRVAAMILKVVESDYRGVIHIGGDRKTVYEYATTISPAKNIGTLSIHEVNFMAPKDTSLNTELYRSLFGKNNHE